MNKNEPLGLPKGSIRSLVTLLIVGTACQQVIAGAIPVEAFLPTVGAVITYYFVSRDSDSEEALAEPYVPEEKLSDPFIDGDAV